MEVSGKRHVPAALYPWERAPGTQWIGDWVDLRAGLDTEARAQVRKLWGAPWWGFVGPLGWLGSIVWVKYLFSKKYGRKVKYVFWYALCLIEIFNLSLNIGTGSPAKVTKICYSLTELYVKSVLLEFIRVEVGSTFMRHCKGGRKL
jgi:hypothetical protein